MTNRIRQYDDTAVSYDFSRYSVYSQAGALPWGEEAKEFVEAYIKYVESKAKEEGKQELLRKISSGIGKQIDEYINLVTKIADVVCEGTNKEFGDGNLNIVDVRTDFHFNTRKIEILFVIDADDKSEISFCELLNIVRQLVLKEQNFVAKLLYINKRGAKLDSQLIRSDYPLERRKKP